ncbi:S10 family peptidase [Altericroceibacterium endophyticum]|uniref:Septum formation initiator n=1 Tax=Altericroceibacterium endophyticum TaxID=1808508 RepID=A0A6I4T7F1_9SPHN|nr:septum formation initiator [Altericroceibacterium endophyticum]MXO66172.1 septum formation initiator [Altericroceibacterium endophyticum]
MPVLPRLCLSAFVLAATACPALAAPGEVLATRENRVESHGTALSVTTEAGLVGIESSPGHVDGSAGYISYVAKDDGADRPVLFIFNGGPGASSSFLHMGALAPVRAEVPQDPQTPLPAQAKITANNNTLLDLADLVFIDPPGTGFSNIADNADRDFYMSTHGDAEAASQLVTQWLADHDRKNAPIYILGESYGTIRATEMVATLHEMDAPARLQGVILLGQALNMIETSQRPDNIVTYPVSLPSQAAIACYHGVITQPCKPEEIAQEVSDFAEEYLHALYQGRDVPTAEKRAVAEKLAEFTGISADYFLTHDLRISKERFRVALLQDRGLVTGRYDARYTERLPDDAGLLYGPDPFSAVSNLYGEAMKRYLANDLGLPNTADYKVLNQMEGSWSYGSGDSPFNDWPFMTIIEDAMERNPDLRLFVGSGMYDLTTTIGAADYLIAQSDIAQDRYSLNVYPAGHVAYSDDVSWAKLMVDLRRFISQDN